MPRVNISPHFKRAYRNLATHLQNDFDEKIRIFMDNPRDGRLRAHKLKGKLQSCLVFRLIDGYRALFEYVKRDEVNMLDIGPHDKYKQWRKT